MRFGIKVGMAQAFSIVLLGVLALAIAYTSALQSEVARFQPSISDAAEDRSVPNGTTNNKLPNRRRLSESAMNANDSFAASSVQARGHLKRRAQSGKGSGKGKSSKSSKKSGNEGRSCDGLRSLVFDLNTRIGDMGAETIRFNALADELERIALYASNGKDEGIPSRRKLSAYVDDDLGELESGVENLIRHRDNLKQGNERVAQLNSVLRTSADVWFETNDFLFNQNGALSDEVAQLKKENERLVAERSRLAEQIDDLREQVGNFTDLVDDQATLNEELNSTTAELELQIERLMESNLEYQRLNEELSDEIDRLDRQNMDLQAENANFTRLNNELNATALGLVAQVQNLTDEVDELRAQNALLDNSISDLAEQVANVSAINVALEGNITSLSFENDRLSNQTAELKETNSELETILSFLEETDEGISESTGTITEYLAAQIVASRTIATETLQNLYLQRVNLWDCTFRTYFGDEDFATDDTVEIPGDEFEKVAEYINERVLSELCLSISDFNKYMKLTFQFPPLYTTEHVVSGISSYSQKALAYYFPSEGDSLGISEDEWALAGYDCNNLPGNRRFEFEKMPAL